MEREKEEQKQALVGFLENDEDAGMAEKDILAHE